MGKLLCEQNLRDVWCRNESIRAEICQILQTHTRVSYSSIDIFFLGIFITVFIIIFKWTFKLSTYLNLLLFNRDGLFNYLAIFINI